MKINELINILELNSNNNILLCEFQYNNSNIRFYFKNSKNNKFLTLFYDDSNNICFKNFFIYFDKDNNPNINPYLGDMAKYTPNLYNSNINSYKGVWEKFLNTMKNNDFKITTMQNFLNFKNDTEKTIIKKYPDFKFKKQYLKGIRRRAKNKNGKVNNVSKEQINLSYSIIGKSSTWEIIKQGFTPIFTDNPIHQKEFKIIVQKLHIIQD